LVLAFGVMLFAGGVGDWRLIANINDPLPQAMKIVVGQSSAWLHVLVFIGLLGLVASFHGIILGYSRQIFALAREGYLPAGLSYVHARFKTPVWAILAGGVIGMAAVSLDDVVSVSGQSLTALLVTMSALGALLMYAISMAGLLRLRASEPDLPRSFKAPFYPWFPLVALILSVLALVAIAVGSPVVFGLFVAMGVVGFVLHTLTFKPLWRD